MAEQRSPATDVVAATSVTILLQQLGREVPTTLVATTFPITDHEDRYLAWTMLGLAPYLKNSAEVQKRFSGEISGISVALATPDELMAKEVAAAIAVPGSGVDRNHLPGQLTTWAGSVRGCDGFTALYRPVRAETRCTLEATAQILAAGLGNP